MSESQYESSFLDPNVPGASEQSLQNNFAIEVKRALDHNSVSEFCKNRSDVEIRKAYHYAVLWYGDEIEKRGDVVREAKEAGFSEITERRKGTKLRSGNIVEKASIEEVQEFLIEAGAEIRSVQADTEAIRKHLAT